MVAAMVIMGTTLALTGRPAQIPAEFWGAILLSSLTGIVLGDFLLFATMRRLGPRRTNVLFATNAVFAALLGWIFLGDCRCDDLACRLVWFSRRCSGGDLWQAA